MRWKHSHTLGCHKVPSLAKHVLPPDHRDGRLEGNGRANNTNTPRTTGNSNLRHSRENAPPTELPGQFSRQDVLHNTRQVKPQITESKVGGNHEGMELVIHWHYRPQLDMNPPISGKESHCGGDMAWQTIRKILQ
jgi:hypothetical protein